MKHADQPTAEPYRHPGEKPLPKRIPTHEECVAAFASGSTGLIVSRTAADGSKSNELVDFWGWFELDIV